MKVIIKTENRKTLEIIMYKHISEGWKVKEPIKSQRRTANTEGLKKKRDKRSRRLPR